MSWARAAALSTLGFVAAPPVAHGYVRTTAASTGAPLAWENPSIRITLHAGNPPSRLNRDTLVRATRAAAAEWSGSRHACTSVEIATEISPEPRADAVYDKKNRIAFRDKTWRREPCDPGQEICDPYGPEILAVTTVTHTPGGAIVDADIEINAVDHEWADVLVASTPSGRDFQDMFTHELGHVIGFEHTCLIVPVERWPRDHDGRMVPLCHQVAGAKDREGTMFPATEPGETLKRDLAADDIMAVCEVYPASAVVAAWGCTVGRSAETVPGTLAVAVASASLVLQLLARRRGRSSGP